MLRGALIAPFADYDFMRRALVGLVVITLGAVPIGTFLMLRRMSLAGDAMAHAILPGAAIGYLLAGLSLPAMTAGGLVAGGLVALLSGIVTRLTALKEDTSLAAFYLLSLALGVTLVSLKGSSIDLLHVLFGSVLAIDDPTLLLLGTITSVTLAILAMLYRPLVMESVDPLFLRSVGGAAATTHLVFLGLVVLNLVAGFHALGTLLAVGLMMLPVAAGRFWSADITAMTLVAVLIGLVSSVAGLLASFHGGLPAGPAVILSAGFLYLLSVCVGPQGGLLWLLWRRPHLQA